MVTQRYAVVVVNNLSSATRSRLAGWQAERLSVSARPLQPPTLKNADDVLSRLA